MPDLTDELRDKISAAIAAGDFEGALASLREPLAPVRKTLFPLTDLIEDDELVEVDLGAVAAACDARVLWLRAEMQVAVSQHVAKVISRLRGRADEY